MSDVDSVDLCYKEPVPAIRVGFTPKRSHTVHVSGHCQGCSIRIRAVLGEVKTPTKRVLSRSYFMPQDQQQNQRNQCISWMLSAAIAMLGGWSQSQCVTGRRWSETCYSESERKLVRSCQIMSNNVR